jgi:ABC-type nitrate/sulfonate/bicarbonate transport system substrate-binding protein
MRRNSHRHPLRLGFVALADCAPVVMAHELGLFARYGIEVELHREVGWATIRDKVLYGELDAAQAPAGIVVSATCGIDSVAAECLTGLVLNLHGGAITLSKELWNRGARDGEALRSLISLEREPLVFGVAHHYSSHSFLLREWLRRYRIDPDREVRIVVVPPPQVVANLKAGHLDGCCVGEPYNSLAVMTKVGWCVAISPELAPGHPEKVLMVRRDFAERQKEEHLALIAALIESCRFCDRPENRERLTETLAESQYVNTPIRALQMSLEGTFDFGNGRVEKVADFHIFARGNANEPTPEKARWVIDSLHAGALLDPSDVPEETALRCFRNDLHHQALQLIQTS